MFSILRPGLASKKNTNESKEGVDTSSTVKESRARDIQSPTINVDGTSLGMTQSQGSLRTLDLELPNLETEQDGSSGDNLPLSDLQSGEVDTIQDGLSKSGTSDIQQETEEAEMIPEELEELREILPMFSDKRLKRILAVFHTSLGDPSMLDLVLVVRERMPDYIDNTWLRKMSNLTASYLMAEAEQKDHVDTHFLNSILSLIASCGRINEALQFHQTEFEKRNLEPTVHSDRLVFEMFLAQNRFQRAMAFKQKLAGQSRKIDIKCYGTLVEYCARRRQSGSALMLIRECMKVHGTPPDESGLRFLRKVLNHQGIDDDPEVLRMIGQDPMYWVKRSGQEAQLTNPRKGYKQHMVRQIRNAPLRG